MDTAQSNISGAGFAGMMANWILNSARGKSMFNNFVAVKSLQETAKSAPALLDWIHSPWGDLSESQRKDIMKTFGFQNIHEAWSDWDEYATGDQEAMDAMMNYNEYPANDKDRLWELLYGDKLPSGSIPSKHPSRIRQVGRTKVSRTKVSRTIVQRRY
jgi:hypothetical protein